MYRVYATIQAAAIRSAPLRTGANFAFDLEQVLATVDASTRIVFVCSPNNPTGTIAPRQAIADLARELAGRALLVVDAAYQDYADDQGLDELLDRYDHVVVLRTLSKFVALAGARCGAVIAHRAVIGFLENVLPPYTFPTTSIEVVLAALRENSLAIARERITIIRRERDRLSAALARLDTVIEVYPSQANFILARLRDRDAFVAAARRAGVLVRTFGGDPALADCVRITIGRPEDNNQLLEGVQGGTGR
jgi:histidinol-phosphate aminotransferase